MVRLVFRLYTQVRRTICIARSPGLHQSFLWLRPARHSSPSFGPGGRRVEWGARWPTPRAPAGATRARPRGRYATLLGHRDDVIRWRDHPPGLVASRTQGRSTPRSRRADGSPSRDNDRWRIAAPIRFPPDNFKHFLTLFSKSFSSFPQAVLVRYRSRRYLAFDGIYRPIWAAFPNNPTSPTTPAAATGSGHNGLSPSLAPHSMGLAPVRPQRTLQRLHFERRKAADSHTGLFPFATATRGILRVFPPDLGSHPSKASGSRRQLPAGVLSEPGPRTRLRATQGQGGRSHHHCRGRVPLGQSVFQPTSPGGKDDQSARPLDDSRARRRWGQQGTGGENTPGVTPRLDGSRDSAIHTKYRISPRSSSIARARYPLSSRVRLPWFEVEVGPPAAKASFALAQIAPKWLFVVFAPRPSRVADAEPAGRRSLTPGAGDSTGAATRRARRRQGIVVQLARLVAPLRGIDNDPSAGYRLAEYISVALRRPEHLRASQTCYCLKLPWPKRHSPSKKLAVEGHLHIAS
ncbi:hypothetical protein H6P81_021248 [Aristolochia fimbriata]|uniref:Protein TAR1 n=1 Tax=Aristolochia fimbriata TaxID=158543 RepID=A0AAV7DV51_ARIFI|nr:hypothetical protein H6P81_021248 [Aristolochia fimbriata]